MQKDLPKSKQPAFFDFDPARDDFSILSFLFKASVVGVLLVFSLLLVVIATSLVFTPKGGLYYTFSEPTPSNQVLGASTEGSEDGNLFGKIVKTLLQPVGKMSLWLVKLAGEDERIIDPLTTTEINDIFEYDATGDKVIVKKPLVLQNPLVGSVQVDWNSIQNAPDFLTSLNDVTGVGGNIKLVEGSNIEITSDKSKNKITISSTGSVNPPAGGTGSSSSSVSVNLSAGTGISISGTSPNFTISNTNLGSSQNIFKNVAVSGESAVVADSNNDTLTFAEGAGINITTAAGSDTVTIAATGAAVSVPFSGVTAGTNANALVVGTGGSLSVSGSGTITATNLIAGSSVVSDLEVDDNITISAAGSVAAAAVTGALTDTQVSNTLTIDGTGGVNWGSLNTFPAGCGANNAVTAVGASLTCSVFWNAGNDGAGSGLDADLLDGISSASFAQKAAAETISGGWVFDTAATTFTTAVNANGGVTTTAGDLTLSSTSGNINIGTSTLLGTTAVIDFNDFDVSNDGHITLTPNVIFPSANYMDIIAPSTFVASSTVINVYGISSAGDLSTTIDASGETIDWRAVNLTLPAINSAQEAADVINRVGILITAGAITAGAGTETSIAIDVSDADLVTGLALGTNDVTVGGATISSAEFARLDGHDVALVDTNDAVGTAITGTGALTSGSIAAGFGTITTSNTITGTILTASTAASGLVLGSGANATTLSSTATVARAISLPDEPGTICTTGSVCSGYQASGFYALTALSNLASVAINTTLLPNAAGTIHLGSGTLPFGDIFIAGTSGTPGTNNFKITGASTSGTRTITLPDESGTVCTNTSVCSTYSPVAGSASITTVGALANGSIATGFGTISTTNTITGTTLNGTTGINTGAGAGTQRIDASGNLSNIGNLTLTGTISDSDSDVNISDGLDVSGHAAFGNGASVDANRVINIVESTATQTGSMYGVNATFTYTGTDTLISTPIVGVYGAAIYNGSGTGSGDDATGGVFIASKSGSRSLGSLEGIEIQLTTGFGSTGTITDATGINILSSLYLGSIPTTLYGVRIQNQGHASATNVYGLNIADQTNAGTGTYGIYQAGTDDLNVLGGNTRIGSTVNPTVALDVSGQELVTFNPSADSGTTNNFVEIAGTTPVDTVGVNTHNFLFINPTIGNATGGTNTVNGISIDNITADVQVSETAINIGTGWDTGVIITGTTGLTTQSAAIFGTAATPYSYTHTGTETGNVAKINIKDTSTNTSGISTTNGLNIASEIDIGNSFDFSTHEVNAINIAPPTLTNSRATTNWTGVNVNSSNYTQSIAGATTLTFKQLQAGSSGISLTNALGSTTVNWEGVEVNIPALTETAGTLSANGIDISTGAAGAGSSLRGINIGNASGASTDKLAINIGSGWDADLNLQNGETIDNNTDGTITFTDGTNTFFYAKRFSTFESIGGFRYIEFDAQPYLQIPNGDTLLVYDGNNTIFQIVDAGASGTVGVGFAGTVTTNGVCQSGTDIDVATDTRRDLVACSGAPGDIAEWYESNGGLEAGDLLVVTKEMFTYEATQVNAATGEVLPDKATHSVAKVSKTGGSYAADVIGVVSTSPVQTYGRDVFDQGQNPVPVAIAGRVPVKVSTENGDIAPGDALTSSSIPGVAMKATKSGPIIGKALESYRGSGVSKIMVFVSVGWYVAPMGADVSSKLSDLSEIDVGNLFAGTITTDVLFIGDRKLDMTTDGSLVIDGSVNILGDLKVEGELTAEKLNVSDNAAGSATLPAGQTKIEIETTLVTDKSQVLITLNTLTEKAIAVTKKEPGKGFTVEISNPETKDINFDWLVVN